MSIQLGQIAPDFGQQSTHGPIRFHEWLGNSWGLFFSHPKNFTPVCTTELGEVARLAPEWQKRGIKPIGLSVDVVDAHNRWADDIKETQGHALNFPMIADADAHVANLYGMIHPETDATVTVRSVFVIDPSKKVRLILTYPPSAGRNFQKCCAPSTACSSRTMRRCRPGQLDPWRTRRHLAGRFRRGRPRQVSAGFRDAEARPPACPPLGSGHMHNFPSVLATGYRHFREGDFQLAAGRYQQLATEGQKPSTMVIACCDGRSAPELIFSRGPGDLFVIRNIANMVPSYEPDTNLHGTSAAIEYGIKALKVSDVVVLCHAGCGRIQAALYPDAELIQNSAFIGNWMQLLASTTSRLPTDLPDDFRASQLERLAVGQSLLNLRTFAFVHGLERAGNLRLHGTWFDVGTGELWGKDPHSDAFDRLSSDGDVVPGRVKGL